MTGYDHNVKIAKGLRYANITRENHGVKLVREVKYANMVRIQNIASNVEVVRFVSIIGKEHFVGIAKAVKYVNTINKKHDVKNVKAVKYVSTVRKKDIVSFALQTGSIFANLADYLLLPNEMITCVRIATRINLSVQKQKRIKCINFFQLIYINLSYIIKAFLTNVA